MLQHTKGLCGCPVNRSSTKRPPTGTKLDRWSTGGIPRPLGKPRSISRMFNTRSRKEKKRGASEEVGVPDCKTDNWETARMHATNTYVKEMDMVICYEKHDINKNAKRKTKPDHKGNIITHSRKWQELELQIWKVTSGVLQHSTTTRGSRPEI